MEEELVSDSYSFFECNKDLKTETLIDNTQVKQDDDDDDDGNEEAALDLEEEEEKEYIAMKQELEETAQRMEKRAYDSSHVELLQNDEKLGEYLQPFLVIPMKNTEATCIRFSKDSNDLLAIGTSAGTIEIHHWHATSEKHLAVSSELNNEIFAVDHHSTGLKFATSGYDFKVRIYDGITRLPIQTFAKGNGVTTAGHSNRVFAVKWHPSDINITLSAGWDNTVQVWDARTGSSVRSIYGVQMYGDALDITEEHNRVLTGSWRRTNQLQEWDYGSSKLLENIRWPQGNGHDEPSRLYAAMYGTKMSQNLIVAGGSGTNEACLFDIDSKEVLGRISTGDKGVYGVAFSCNGTQLAVLTPTAVYLNSISKSLCNISDVQ